jgi:hypothetical protein
MEARWDRLFMLFSVHRGGGGETRTRRGAVGSGYGKELHSICGLGEGGRKTARSLSGGGKGWQET